MMTTAQMTQLMQETTTPSADMAPLERLVGTWALSGDTSGQVRYAWMEGGHFLIQHVDLTQDGHTNRGIEIIGYEQVFGAPRSEDIKSRFYGSDGATFDYVYELDGDTLTIWGGAKGSPAYYRGTFSADGNRMSGSWVYPGGGYDSTMTRVGA